MEQPCRRWVSFTGDPGMTSQGLTSDQGGPVPQAAFDALFAFLTAQQAGSGIPAIVAQLKPLVAAIPDGV